MPHKTEEARRKYNQLYYEKKRQKGIVNSGEGNVFQQLNTKVENDIEEKVIEKLVIEEKIIIKAIDEKIIEELPLDIHYAYIRSKLLISKDYEVWYGSISRVNKELLRMKALFGRFC
jgi:hypothetical protein